MPKTVTIKQSTWNGGISDSIRQNQGNTFSIAKGFDAFSDPQRLIPYRSLETDTNDGSTATGMKQYFVRDFLHASATDKLYGLGQTGAGLTKIVYKAASATGNWTLPANSEGNGVVKNGCLVEYKDYLWGFQGTTSVFKWGLLSGTPSITNSAGTVGTITSVAQGLINRLDELNLFYNNKVVRVTENGTVTDEALVLPSNYKITSACNFGKYIAIGCSPVSTFNGVSKVFFWDGVNEDITDVVDWGEGELRILDTVEGYLVGITDRYLNSANGAGKGSMIVQIYTGGNSANVVKEVFTQTLTGKTIPLSKAVRNNRIFWSAKIMTNTAGTEYDEGIWSFGRKNANSPFALNLDIIDENIDTSGVQAFGTAANYFFVSHSNDGSIDKTNDENTFTFTSALETTIFNFDASETEKRLEQVRVAFAPLTTGQTLTVKYRVDEETTWSTIGTFNTVGENSYTFHNIEATDVPFKSGKEFKFRLESVGGLEITELALQATILI